MNHIHSEQHTHHPYASGERAAFTKSASHRGGPSLVFIYVNMNAPGLTWQNLNAVIPKCLQSATCLHQTRSGNAILAFRSAHAQRDYQRLASQGQTEVMVLMNETTLWGGQLLERLISSGLKLHELPVLSNDHEKLLLKFVTILAKGFGLHVTMQNDATGTASTTQFTSSVITPHIDRP
jgi:hypothetical protein